MDDLAHTAAGTTCGADEKPGRVIGIAALSWGQGAAAETITVTDLAGRTVEVPHGAKKVILGEGRMF
ncbi:hypothetical protein RM190_19885 [Paracoccus sp. CPCC 101403]|uniref:Uncharacterized protein n=1 Tax=Paracoccus broussonetiae TaxID=3075834 RepID=A0ABU3EIR5_9RHOB|nr:hypothetical protein [Paracoccus sp. CPCC 101403]MDT1064133.1 hypothetical protein [Paracoccus sp. CPCC 101403]